MAQDNQNTINYLYDAAGTKLQKVTSSDKATGLTTDYNVPFVYEGSKLAFIQTSEGRVVPDHDTYAYEYFLKDHLGNTRVVFNEQGEVLQIEAKWRSRLFGSNSYYPFGGIMEGLNYTAGLAPENKYLYNGKEMQDDFGLNWYDYGARFYDAQLGRFHIVDPMAEEAYNWTPFRYAFNNPLFFIDPDGFFETVNPKSKEALNMIKNTLSKDDAEYVQLDKNGNIDAKLLNNAQSNSGNLADLKTLVNDETTYEVSISSGFEYKTETGELKTESFGEAYYTDFLTGEHLEEPEGFLGQTLTPGKEANKYNSKDEIVRIHVNKGLNERDKARIYSHEANGHAILYSEGRDHMHRAKSTSEGLIDANKELVKLINSAIKETENNYDERNN